LGRKRKNYKSIKIKGSATFDVAETFLLFFYGFNDVTHAVKHVLGAVGEEVDVLTLGNN
jgi:hypothetical protein